MASWATFYEIVGSAGATLIGMQFVIMTLLVAMRRRPTAETLAAFGGPTVAHLASALMISAIMAAPWPSFVWVSDVLVMIGAAGLVYSAIVVRRIGRQAFYTPVWQDWVWCGACPCAAYLTIAMTATILHGKPFIASFAIAAAVLGLLVIGIHNAWDSVSHLVTGGFERDTAAAE